MSLLVSGSFVKLDDTIQFLNRLDLSGTFATIRSQTNHLVLSSSAGSIIAVSGTLKICAGPSGSSLFVNSVGNALTLSASAGITLSHATTLSNTLTVTNGTTLNGTLSVANDSTFNGLVTANNTASFNAPVKVVGAQVNINNGLNLASHILANNSDLILSYSTISGSAVAVSGALKLGLYTTGTLPVNGPSGSVVWLDDVKCFVGYGPEGWVRILTGTI